MTESKWTTEFFEDDAGRRPVELWMDSLTVAEFAALRAAIIRVLEVRGIELGSTPWLKALGEGLFEFRVRHDAATIEALYATTTQGEQPAQPTQRKILLRLFVHFHGNKVILLLHGYDKGGNDSPRQQNKEIKEARKRLASWKAAEAKRTKDQRRRK
ncbi:hypothetical protein RB608_26305 [Nocardioides sp. LHD-245]|uniref:hypothetical protein n=1 Tax=Nocardioides sp. LHD-245 TaxID=3051387 RepID=UPI0027DFF51D|nr:hypothetical protein [Nocardioides sp. LHD-245]